MPIVVTALYDLAQLENEPRRRSAGEYLTFGRELFRGNFDLHIFCEPNLVARCEELLIERPDDVNTVIEALPFEELPMWQLGTKARFGLTNGTISRTSSTSNRIKDSSFATTVWWSKLGLMEKVSQQSVNAENQTLWWVDFGISHVSKKLLTQVFDVEQPRFATLGPIENISDSEQEFFENGIPNALGGIFAVPSSHIADLNKSFILQLERVLSMGLLVNDESLLSWLMSVVPCDVVETSFDRIIESFHVEKSGQPELTPPTENESENEGLVDIDQYVLRRITLPNPVCTDRRATNPSLAVHPDGGYFCIVRHVNYEYTSGVYRQLDLGEEIRTENVLLRMNDEFVIEWSSLIDDAMLCGHAELFPVFGLEDARLFHREGSWWASGTCREHRDDGRCQILLCKLAVDEPHQVRIESSIQLPFLSKYRHEKNWMPIMGDVHEWVWGVQPTVRIKFDDVTQSLVPSRSAKGDLSIRGGSQVVPWGNQWLAVVHDVKYENERRVYRHRFVRWNAQWDLEFVSEPFRLGDDEFGLEFCAGLVVCDDGKRLLLSAGIGDSRAELIEMTIPDWL